MRFACLHTGFSKDCYNPMYCGRVVALQAPGHSCLTVGVGGRIDACGKPCVNCCVSVQDAGPLPLAAIVDVAMQGTAGLHHLHTHGILHRDLRCANVLVTSASPLAVVIADLGLAHRLSKHVRGSATGTATGDVGSLAIGHGGPVWWLAPEALVAHGGGGWVATPASDVYMLGGLMFELLTGGRRPYWCACKLVCSRNSFSEIELDSHVDACVSLELRWLDWEVVHQRRCLPHSASRDGVVGLGGCSVFEAASIDGKSIEYPDVVQGALGSPHRRVFESLVGLVQACVRADSGHRPRLHALHEALCGMLELLPESVGRLTGMWLYCSVNGASRSVGIGDGWWLGV